MRRLPLIIIPLLIVMKLVLQGFNPSDSPHGKSLKISCSVCHTSSGWILDEDNTFDHAVTNFHLAGQHVYAACKSCHPTLVFNEAGSSCIDCHTDMHQQTLGMSCERCHTEESWLVSNIFEIHQFGRFPLLGAHAVADCQDCHRTESLLRFEPLGVECYDCHSQVYMATTFPDHQAAGYSTECEECHNLNAYEWTAAGINHTFFPLTDGHAIDDCAECHNIEDYQAISPDCFACHEADYLATTNPDHAAADFSPDCASCHSTTPDWTPANFDHGLLFPLTGAHDINDCAQCHNIADYGAVSSDCFSCHENDYNATSNPNHLAANFTTDCASCHSTSGEWVPATFDHDEFFPLTGAHDIKDCARCHNIADYTTASSDCFSCHEKDYNTTTNPNHLAANFTTDCASCHSTTGEWVPATFDHEVFPLTGVHNISDCAKCHIGGNYDNASSLCYSCHESDYKNARDPNHAIAGFSTDCELCHTTFSDWSPSTFDHDSYFPIYSGKHRGEWNSCLDCHTNSSNYVVFSCTDCHEHTKSREDDHHKEIRDYVYVSSACYDCHPQGRAEGN